MILQKQLCTKCRLSEKRFWLSQRTFHQSGNKILKMCSICAIDCLLMHLTGVSLIYLFLRQLPYNMIVICFVYTDNN